MIRDSNDERKRVSSIFPLPTWLTLTFLQTIAVAPLHSNVIRPAVWSFELRGRVLNPRGTPMAQPLFLSSHYVLFSSFKTATVTLIFKFPVDSLFTRGINSLKKINPQKRG